MILSQKGYTETDPWNAVWRSLEAPLLSITTVDLQHRQPLLHLCPNSATVTHAQAIFKTEEQDPEIAENLRWFYYSGYVFDSKRRAFRFEVADTGLQLLVPSSPQEMHWWQLCLSPRTWGSCNPTDLQRDFGLWFGVELKEFVKQVLEHGVEFRPESDNTELGIAVALTPRCPDKSVFGLKRAAGTQLEAHVVAKDPAASLEKIFKYGCGYSSGYLFQRDGAIIRFTVGPNGLEFYAPTGPLESIRAIRYLDRVREWGTSLIEEKVAIGFDFWPLYRNVVQRMVNSGGVPT